MILVDTNVLVKLIHAGNPHQQPARGAVALLHRQSEILVACPQSLYEMYVVCTRPTANRGLGPTPIDAAARIEAARSQFPCEPELPSILDVWLALVKKHGVSGKQAHDARLAAYMTDHRIPAILTFNDKDFIRYSPLTVLHPCDVLGIPRI
jgi:predicted nucleic acid-binding protein